MNTFWFNVFLTETRDDERQEFHTQTEYGLSTIAISFCDLFNLHFHVSFFIDAQLLHLVCRRSPYRCFAITFVARNREMEMQTIGFFEREIATYIGIQGGIQQ